MLPSAGVTFNYGMLSVEKAASARAAAERIKLRMARAAQDIIEVGQELSEQQDSMGHGNFLAWIESEFSMSQRTAYNFMSVHKEFGSKLATVASLPPTALYALAAPSAEPVREEAFALAANGESVTAKVVAELKARHERLQEKLKEQAGVIKARDDMVAIAERQSQEAHTRATFAVAERERLTEQVAALQEEVNRATEPGVVNITPTAQIITKVVTPSLLLQVFDLATEMQIAELLLERRDRLMEVEQSFAAIAA